MIAPNLARRPFLNTRPVWLLTAVAAVLALLVGIVDLRLYMDNERDLASQLARRAELTERYSRLEAEAAREVAELSKIPWSALSRQVERVNIVLREHGFSWLGLLSDVERVMPWAVRFVRISPAVEEGSVKLALLGAARNRDAMLELIDNLIDDASFDRPIPSSEKTPEESAGGEYEFELRVTYLPEATASAEPVATAEAPAGENAP